MVSSSYFVVALINQLREDVGDSIQNSRLHERHNQGRGHNE